MRSVRWSALVTMCSGRARVFQDCLRAFLGGGPRGRAGGEPSEGPFCSSSESKTSRGGQNWGGWRSKRDAHRKVRAA
eukprot:5872552-Amphidinium_carterae.2